MRAVSVLIKPASGHCNMRCDYCFYADEGRKREQECYGMMSEETLKNVIRKTLLRAESSAGYAFQGGEPTLRGLDFFRKVIELQKKYNKNGVQIQNVLQTNGVLIDDAWCQFLKEHRFLVGLSVDGTRDIHNRLRHLKEEGDAFAQAERAARLFDKWGVDYNILTVVTPQISEHIPAIYRDYKKRGWNYQQYIACLDPLGEARGTSPYSITPEAYGQFLCRLFDLWYEDIKKGRALPYIRQFENYVGMEMGYLPEACDMAGTCSLQYVVEADGSVYPCDFYALDEYKLGNFNQDTLDSLDRKRNETGFIERSQNLDTACRACGYYYLCKGGCQRNRSWSQQAEAYQNYFCPSYQTFFAHCQSRIKELANRNIFDT